MTTIVQVGKINNLLFKCNKYIFDNYLLIFFPLHFSKVPHIRNKYVYLAGPIKIKHPSQHGKDKLKNDNIFKKKTKQLKFVIKT